MPLPSPNKKTQQKQQQTNKKHKQTTKQKHYQRLCWRSDTLCQWSSLVEEILTLPPLKYFLSLFLSSIFNT